MLVRLPWLFPQQKGFGDTQPYECRFSRHQHHGKRGKAVAERDGEEMINRFGLPLSLPPNNES